MKTAMVLIPRLLAIYLGMFGALLLIAETVVGAKVYAEAAQKKKPCAKCTEGWRNAKVLLGGLECAHGPNVNQEACGKPPYEKPNFDVKKACFEYGNAVYKKADGGTDKKCECFKCGLSGKCEGEFFEYDANCGLEDKEHNDGCDVVLWTGETGKARIGPVRYERDAIIPKGEACKFDKDGRQVKKYCGNAGSAVLVDIEYACISTNGCQGSGKWNPVKGPVPRCKGYTGSIPAPPLPK